MKDISFAKKIKLLYLIFALLAYLLYHKVFVGTIQLVKNTNELSRQINQNKMAGDLEDVKVELDNYPEPAILSGDSTQPSNEVLGYLSAIMKKKQIKIERLTPNTISYFSKYSINIFTVVLSGDFHQILQVVNSMEKELTIARIASLKFYTTENQNTEEQKLYSEIYFQYVTTQ